MRLKNFKKKKFDDGQKQLDETKKKLNKVKEKTIKKIPKIN